MSHSISLGPVVLPGSVLALFIGLIVARIILHRYKGSHRDAVVWIVDRGATALLAAFLVWKIWPVFRWWDAILEDPIVLLRLPGGTPGIVAAIVTVVAVFLPGIVRERSRVIPTAAAVVGLGVGFALTLAVLETVNAQPRDASSFTGTDLTVLDLEGNERPLISPSVDAGSGNQIDRSVTPGITVLTFWATWCGPCRAELPVKEEFYDTYGDSVQFVSVNMTPSESSVATVDRYVEEHDISYPVVLDQTGEVANLFGIRGTPTTVVLDSDLTVLARWTGPSSYDRLVRAVRSER